MLAETVFLMEDNVTVTNTSIEIEGQTFTMDSVSSAWAERDSLMRWALVIIAVILLFAAGGGQNEAQTAMRSFGLIAAVIALLMKPRNYLYLETTAGKKTALSSKDGQFVQRVLEAINKAIAARG